MRQTLCGGKGGPSSAATEAEAAGADDEDFGATRRRPGPLLPTAAPAALVAAQTWLEKAEDAAVSRS